MARALLIIIIVLLALALVLGWVTFSLTKARGLYEESTREYEHASYNYSLASGKYAYEYLETGDYHRELGERLSRRADKWSRLGLYKTLAR